MGFEELLRAHLEEVAAGTFVPARQLAELQETSLDLRVQVEAYAVETYLVRVQRPQQSVTQLGQVFQRLRGRDAVRWLLTSEVLQSVGAADPWRAPVNLLAEALLDEESSFVHEDDTGTLGYSSRTLHRLRSFGVLILDHAGDPEARRWGIWDSMRELVESVLAPGPWHAAVKALLDDERAVILPGTSASARDATIEQTKLIAHEVRNALIPVRHDLDALRASSLEVGPRKRVDHAREGVARVLDFVEAMVQASEMITEPASPCDLGAVAEEALSWIDPERRVERRIATASPVIAPRTPLTRAISNVIGNALQATPAGQPIRLSVRQEHGVAFVIVDDGGPGVPGEHRRRVFQDGVTMRKDGAGSGFGLAYAQRVVEGTLRGRIWCEDSDLGGARFVIELPDASSR